MALSNTAFPASLRKPMETVRFGTGFIAVPTKPYLVLGTQGRTDSKISAVLKGRFARLPQEPEDARMTGVTRSLNRRLLGLNLRGSLLSPACPGLRA